MQSNQSQSPPHIPPTALPARATSSPQRIKRWKYAKRLTRIRRSLAPPPATQKIDKTNPPAKMADLLIRHRMVSHGASGVQDAPAKNRQKSPEHTWRGFSIPETTILVTLRPGSRIVTSPKQTISRALLEPRRMRVWGPVPQTDGTIPSFERGPGSLV